LHNRNLAMTGTECHRGREQLDRQAGWQAGHWCRGAPPDSGYQSAARRQVLRGLFTVYRPHSRGDCPGYAARADRRLLRGLLLAFGRSCLPTACPETSGPGGARRLPFRLAVKPMLADQEHAVYDFAPGTEFVGAGQLPAHSLYGAQRAAHRFGDLLGGSALSVQLKEPPHLRFTPRLPDFLHCLPPRGAVCRFAMIEGQTSRITFRTPRSLARDSEPDIGPWSPCQALSPRIRA